MTTSSRLKPPEGVVLPTKKIVCPTCNGEGRHDIYPDFCDDPGNTIEVDCQNRDCEDGLVEVLADAFVIYDKLNQCWVGCDFEEDDYNGKAFQAETQDEASEYQLWQNAEEDVELYRKTFGLELSDLSFDDALVRDPNL
jgi:hypothetical protein